MDNASGAPGYGAYLIQVARAYRFLDRARGASGFDLRTEPQKLNDLEDNLWATFQNCWHIKDWVMHDSSIAQRTRDAIWADVKSSDLVRIVADVANGTKHFELERPWTTTGLAPMQVVPNANGSWTIEHRIRLEDHTEVPALELAERALSEWKRIFRRHNLAFVTP